MCHDHFTRDRVWTPDRTETDEEAERDDDEFLADEPIPPLQDDADPDEDVEILTDGGDE